MTDQNDTPADKLRCAEEALADVKRGFEERARNLQPNQCPGCGAYRLDGLPPEIHEHGCPWEADALDRTFKRMFGGGS